jgi:hypothetical protein
MEMPSLAQSVFVGVGPFDLVPDPKIPSITHFCLPGRRKELANTIPFLNQVRAQFPISLSFFF